MVLAGQFLSLVMGDFMVSSEGQAVAEQEADSDLGVGHASSCPALLPGAACEHSVLETKVQTRPHPCRIPFPSCELR